MKTPHRLIPEWPFPPYLFIPGKNPHPKKAGGYMDGLPDPVATPINLHQPQDSDVLKYAIDLYNHDHFWESHVYFEALWNAHERVGSVADFLKALIKLGAAGVKLQIDQSSNAVDHLERAMELISGVMDQEGEVFLGFNLAELNKSIKASLSSRDWVLPIIPSWK